MQYEPALVIRAVLQTGLLHVVDEVPSVVGVPLPAVSSAALLCHVHSLPHSTRGGAEKAEQRIGRGAALLLASFLLSFLRALLTR